MRSDALKCGLRTSAPDPSGLPEPLSPTRDGGNNTTVVYEMQHDIYDNAGDADDANDDDDDDGRYARIQATRGQGMRDERSEQKGLRMRGCKTVLVSDKDERENLSRTRDERGDEGFRSDESAGP
jgi:hypothetical protein